MAAWGAAIARQPYDYDEIYHLHAAWLVGQGLRPYQDFLVCHPPLPLYLGAALVNWFPDPPRLLFFFRTLTSFGTMLWLAALVAKLRQGTNDLSLHWALAGFAAVLFSRPVLEFVVECRPDTWAYALFFASLLLVSKNQARARFLRYACFGFLAGVAALANLKIGPLAALFVLADTVRYLRKPRDLLAALSGTLAGAATALGATVLWLVYLKINPLTAFDFSIVYQALFVRNSGFRHGLVASLLQNPVPLTIVCLGVAAWLTRAVSLRTYPDPFEVALVAFLIVELFVVRRPYKQYYAPWLLLGASFYPYLNLLFRERMSELVLGTTLLVAGVAAVMSLRDYDRSGAAAAMQNYYKQLTDLSPAGSYIVAPPPFHPIVRHDVFYAWNRTTDPTGYTTERVMQDFGRDEYSRRVSPEFYRNELAKHPPALIVLPVPGDEFYEPQQWRVLHRFLEERADKYDILTKGYVRPVALRRRGSRGS